MKRSLRNWIQGISSKRTTKRQGVRAKLSLECLEGRVFLSGNVLAHVVDGTLIIQGDAAANDVVVEQNGMNGHHVRVVGANGTKINGHVGSVAVSGVSQGIDVRLNGGADSAILRGLNVPGSVAVAQGGGDRLAVNKVKVGGTLFVHNGSTRLTTVTAITDTSVGNDLNFAGGNGRQTVDLESVRVKGDTSISTGAAADVLMIDDSVFHGATHLGTGKGNNHIVIEAHGSIAKPATRFEGAVSISAGSNNDTIQLGLSRLIAPNVTFGGKVHIDGGAGYNVFRNYHSKFTFKPLIQNIDATILAPDTTDPTVTSTSPANNASGVAVNRSIAVTFSEAMDPRTITAANIAVTAPGGVPIAGTVAYVGTIATFTPTSQLAANTAYTMTISTGAADLSENPLASSYVLNFTTGTSADTTAPVVSSTNPVSGATGIALNHSIAATFSEAMNPTTMTGANVHVTAAGGISVAGTVAYAGTTVTFTPASALAANTVFTATISSGAKDLAGNALANDFTWSFTSGATADTTDPTVISTNPANVATGVAVNAHIAASFSEAMDPQTITTANVTLTGPGSVVVAGTVNYVGTTMTFTPTTALAANATYVLTVGSGATDLAGNSLASSFASSFTTGATPDTTAPTVSLTNPADTHTNVPINGTVAATFSEAIDPQSISAADFTVTGPSNNPVMGTVSYDGPNDIATFTPSGNLTANTTYTAKITGGVNGVSDLAGNPLASDKVWTFTTGSQVAQAPVVLGSASTFAVMATASISGTGATTVSGDVGLNPGSSQGIPPNQVNGTIHVDDQASIDAQAALTSAYNDAVNRSVTSVSLPGNMGGLTFTPGLYTNSSSVLISGSGPGNNVTLDAQGNPNAIFIFQMGSTLTTAPGAQVILAGGAKASNIFWQVGTSATLDTTTIFKGNILAAVTITVNNGSAVEGRLLAGANSTGSVTINASSVTLPSA